MRLGCIDGYKIIQNPMLIIWAQVKFARSKKNRNQSRNHFSLPLSPFLSLLAVDAEGGPWSRSEPVQRNGISAVGAIPTGNWNGGSVSRRIGQDPLPCLFLEHQV
jgi:hypothetical protein